jgi:hypothetical protein
VIRRLFWLTLGAAAGVTGYRRLTRLVRAMQPLPVRGSRRGWPGGQYGRRGGYGGTASFLRDVREGMDQYAGRRAGPASPAIEGQHYLAQRSPSAARRLDGTNYSKDGR